MFEFSIAKCMFKVMKGLVPPVLSDMFTTNVNIHNHLTRQRRRLHVPVSRTNIMKKTFRHTGVYTWNKFKDVIDTQSSFSTYKKNLKEYLLST